MMQPTTPLTAKKPFVMEARGSGQKYLVPDLGIGEKGYAIPLARVERSAQNTTGFAYSVQEQPGASQAPITHRLHALG